VSSGQGQCSCHQRIMRITSTAPLACLTVHRTLFSGCSTLLALLTKITGICVPLKR
jgi:hypothetical protein